MRYVIIEQDEDMENALITRNLTKEEVKNYTSLEGGNFIVLSEEAFRNMCGTYCMGK